MTGGGVNVMEADGMNCGLIKREKEREHSSAEKK